MIPMMLMDRPSDEGDNDGYIDGDIDGDNDGGENSVSRVRIGNEFH